MSFNVGDEVWWFFTESSKGNIYPDWLHLCCGKIVWKSTHEEIMHVYADGELEIYVLLDDDKSVFSSKEKAFSSIYHRLKLMEEEINNVNK